MKTRSGRKPLPPARRPFKLVASRPLESTEQTALFAHASHLARTDPRWSLLFAIPNGTAASSMREAAMAKKIGRKRGVPDMFLAVAVWPYHGLFVELKRVGGTASDLSEEQVCWLQNLQQQGYQTVVAFGWKHAADEIKAYLN